MDVDAMKVIDELTQQISRLSYELAVARAQVKTLQTTPRDQPAGTENTGVHPAGEA